MRVRSVVSFYYPVRLRNHVTLTRTETSQMEGSVRSRRAAPLFFVSEEPQSAAPPYVKIRAHHHQQHRHEDLCSITVPAALCGSCLFTSLQQRSKGDRRAECHSIEMDHDARRRPGTRGEFFVPRGGSCRIGMFSVHSSHEE